MSRLASLAAMALAAFVCGVALADAPPAPGAFASVAVNGVRLHYVERGAGEPVIFVHGALDDYREWEPVARSFPGSYRVITYSRRYNFPNDNSLAPGDHSALVEARDLAALIRALHAGPAHIVGASYGAYTALLLAIREPRLVRSLTLVEPPLVGWLPDLPGGRELRDAFLRGMWRPSGDAFRQGEWVRAIRIAFDYFGGPGGFDKLPVRVQAAVLANALEWRALTLSADAFPEVTRAQVRAIRVPVLMISGGRTFPMLKLTDAALVRELADGRRVIVPDGTHEVCSEQPSTCAARIRGFLAAVRR